MFIGMCKQLVRYGVLDADYTCMYRAINASYGTIG